MEQPFPGESMDGLLRLAETQSGEKQASTMVVEFDRKDDTDHAILNGIVLLGNRHPPGITTVTDAVPFLQRRPY
jgi:hypothetical protein